MQNEGLFQVVIAIGRNSPSGVELLGTGFAVTGDKIATAAHVVGQSDKDLVAVVQRVVNNSDYQDTSDNKITTYPVYIVAYNPIMDVAILSIPPGSGFSFQYKIVSTDMLSVGDEIISIGYPHADTGRLVCTQQNSRVGARILIEVNGVKTKQIVMNTQTRPGQSGSPVFDQSGKFLVAMVLGGYRPGGGGVILGNIDPATLHQTTHAVSAEYIGEML